MRIILFENLKLILILGIGDWGLGIGQSPIPNPQSPIYLVYGLIVVS